MLGGLYAKLIAAAAFILVIGLAYLQGRDDGTNLTRGEFAAQRLQEAAEANTAYAGISDRYRAKEAQWAQQSAAVSKTYQRKLDANATALLVASATRLSDPYANPQACRNSAAAATASASGRDGSQGSELSPKFADFLRSEAARADAYTIQLGACQDILESDRAIAR